MQFNISGKHIELTDAIREHAEQKTTKLCKFYDSINQVDVIVDGNAGSGIGVEIIARAEHNIVFVASDTGQDAYRCIDSVVHKLERQIKKKKTQQRDNKM